MIDTKLWAGMGDLISHGGLIIEGALGVIRGGTPVARLGDHAFCRFHGIVSIIQGYPIVIIAGKPVALIGHQLSCGATII